VRLNLNLTQKALILVAVPLVFEVGFVIVLQNLLHEVERENAHQIHVREVSSHLNALLRLIMGSALEGLENSIAHGYYANGNWSRTEWSKQATAERNEVATIKDLVRDYPQERAAFAGVGILRDQIKDLWLETHEAIKAENSPKTLAVLVRVRTQQNKLLQILDTFIAELQVAEKSEMTSQAQKRDLIEKLLIFGVGFNIVLAIFLALYFDRGTTRRLRVLMDNTVRLAAGAPLNPRLSGDDEIARLDKTFNGMAKALAQAARQDAAIVDNALDVICSIDDKGTFTRVSPAAEKLWGYQPDQLLGLKYLTLIAPDDQARTVKAFNSLKSGQQDAPIECRVVHKSGTLIDMLWSARWSDEDRTLFCVAHDITQRNEVERMRQELISMVSHDLRSPLTSVQGFLNILEVGICGELNEKGRIKLAAADRNVTHLISLIQDLLDVERLRSGKLLIFPADVALSELIERSLDAVRMQAEQAGLDLRVEISDMRLTVDGERIVQVLINLLTNAIKFSPSGSAVSISNRKKGDWVEIRVTDQGRGIAPAFHAQIFNRFEQVKASDMGYKGGTGLGLAICKMIINQHGGSIGVDSEEGKGSSFWFRIPMTVEGDT